LSVRKLRELGWTPEQVREADAGPRSWALRG